MKKWQTISILGAIQLLFILTLRADFLTDWDSYLYTYSAMHFQPVELAGGRWFFTALLGSVWWFVNRIHTVPAESAWLVFSTTTMILALTNVGLFYTLACRWIERRPAILATAIFISSPLTGLYGSAVMTETCTLTVLLASLLLVTSQNAGFLHILTAGGLFGLGVAMREPLILLAILPMLLITDSRPIWRWSKVGVFVLMFAGVFFLNLVLAHATAEDWNRISQSWSTGMSRERMQMAGWLPKMLVVNIFCLFCWIGIFSPILLITIPEQIRVFRKRESSWMIPLLLAVVLYTIGQIANHSLVFNPRFILFPAVLLCLPATMGVWRKIPSKYQMPWLIGGIFVGLHFCVLMLLWPVAQGYYFNKSLAAKDVFQSLNSASDNALFVPGQMTPVVEFYKKTYHRDWRIIYGGWDFSDKELFQEIEKSRNLGRQVYLVEPQYWAEKRFRPTQYSAIEMIWNKYTHRPSFIAHFAQITFPPIRTPQQFLDRLLNFLFS